ncbi:hypothetical protein DXG01_006380 [Tephrocybe rancida]|nr:hypothetical protein DXG01_006380 [Tephrocybe rancida]
MGSSIALPPARFKKAMSELFDVVSVEELDNILDSPSHRPEKFNASTAIPPNFLEPARGLHVDTSTDSEATQAQAGYLPIVSPKRRQAIVGLSDPATYFPAAKPTAQNQDESWRSFMMGYGP